jgi:Family of unknown function (DUF6459)
MPSPSSSQESLTRANVIKWTEVLPRSRNTAAAPAAKGTRAAAGARRRQSRTPGPPPGSWPLPGSRPTCPLPNPALAQLCAVPGQAPPYDDEVHGNTRVQESGDADGLPALGRGEGGAHAAARTPAEGKARAEDKTRAEGKARAEDKTRAEGKARADGSPGADAVARTEDKTRTEGKTRGEEKARAEDKTRAEGKARADGRAGPTWPSQFAQVLAETLAGSRPPRQLTPWTTQRARGHIRRLGPLLAADYEPRIRRIVASTPSRGVVEMAVVVRFGPRVRALAVRLERGDNSHSSAWQCTAIEAA